MAQIKKPFDEARIPFDKMSYTPDVPSTALGPNEYNRGINVETDVRGIRSVFGDQEILSSITGTPTYVSSGYRQDGNYWFIVATDEGKWWATYNNTWTDITPAGGAAPWNAAYSQGINISEAWNGTVPIYNDTINAPFFWSEVTGNPTPPMTLYSNLVPVMNIASIAYLSPTTQRITVISDYATVPYAAGQQILLAGINSYYDGVFVVTASTTTTIDYLAVPGAAYPGGGTVSANVSPNYTWNYNPNWKNLTAGFLRLYTTPNVGNILVAGDLTATLLDDSVVRYPTTVQWSQAFGLSQAPATWAPTVVNIANQVDVPLRGPAVDAFPSGGQFFLCSYWDTVVFSPINYSTTSTPILGVRLFNQGRGLLTSNSWANTDKLVYGVDARDIWVFDGNDFTGIGNQRVKNWFYDQLDQEYTDRVFMENNSEKNQIEIYYPAYGNVDGVPNKMLSYRYDLEVWNPPRDVDSATFSCESPVWSGTTSVYTNLTAITVTGTGSGAVFDVEQFGTQYTVRIPSGTTGTGYAIGDTLKILGTSVGGATPANDITITVTYVNTAQASGVEFVTATGNANGSNSINPASRTIVYARGVANSKLVQKDQGYSFIHSQPIVSSFHRDNIKMLTDYSGKLQVHRILPELVNLDLHSVAINPATQPELSGGIVITIAAANAVGQAPQIITSLGVLTDTDNPWVQINQNAFRVNTIELGNTSNRNAWMCSATTWQFTQVEDDR